MPPKKQNDFNFMDWVRFNWSRVYNLPRLDDPLHYADTTHYAGMRLEVEVVNKELNIRKIRVYMPGDQSWIDYLKYGAEPSRLLFEELDHDDMYPKERGKSMGSTVPRDSTNFWRGGDVQTYKFGGKKHIPRKDIPDHLEDFYMGMEELYPGKQFNFAVVNRYKSSCDSISAHADDEEEIIPNSEIASLSLGATRDFIITNNPKIPKKDWVALPDGRNQNSLKMTLKNGDIIVMGGKFQEQFNHHVPKCPLPEDRSQNAKRINITLRQFVRKNQEAIMSKKQPRGVPIGKTRQPPPVLISPAPESAPATQRSQQANQAPPPAPPAPTSFRRRAAPSQGPVTRATTQKSLEIPPPRQPLNRAERAAAREAARAPTEATSQPGPVSNNTRAKSKGDHLYADWEVAGVITQRLKIQPYVETRPNGPEHRAVMEINPNNDYIIENSIDSAEQARLHATNEKNPLNTVAALGMGKIVIVIFNFQRPIHWVGAVIKRTSVNPVEYTAYYEDPLGNAYEKRNGRINNWAHVFFQELRKHVTLHVHDFQVQQQRDGSSCGPLTAENMIMLAQAPLNTPIDTLETALQKHSDNRDYITRIRGEQQRLLQQHFPAVQDVAVDDPDEAARNQKKQDRDTAARRQASAKGAKGNEGDEGEGEGEEAEGDDLILDFTVEDEEQGVKDGMPDGDLNGVRRNRAVNWGRNNPNRPGGPNNPDEDGIPHYTKFLYNTKDDFPEREILLEPRETKDDNDRYRRLAGELLAYARWGKAQRRDIGDLVVRGNNALLANRIITGDEYDARNARIRKRNVFGGPGDDRPYARETYDEYKDKNPLIVGQNIGKKIRKYVIQASRIWPTHAQPARPFDYVDIFNPL
jgi:alkylated DNA repair dioxygenase AlkB